MLRRLSIFSEYDIIQKAIETHGGNKAKAAKFLGINRKTLYNKIGIAEKLKADSEKQRNPKVIA